MLPLGSKPVFRRRYYLVVLCLTLCLAACVAAPPAPPTVVAPTTSRADPTAAAPTLTLTRPPADTPTPQVTLNLSTPAPSRTSRHSELTQDAIAVASEPTGTPAPPPTATFDPLHLVRRTPAPPAQCPAVKPGLPTPNFNYRASGPDAIDSLLGQIRDFLNAGGAPQAIINGYHHYDPDADYLVQDKDVTGDGVPDLLITTPGFMDVLICQNGQYQVQRLISDTLHFVSQPLIVNIVDMNGDGVAEIIAIAGDARLGIVYVLEWDGSLFQLLNQDFSGGRNYPDPCSDLLGPTSWVYAVDTDHNGLLSLVFKQSIPIAADYLDGLPWRKETRTCVWNGSTFELAHTEITDPPQYRFQAVQDGDRASLAGDYPKALDLYQQAIFSDTLQAWSFDRFLYEGELPDQTNPGAPTLMPLPTPDPVEYPSLAAYARYRILLLYVIQGDLTDAKTVYDTLQAKFPTGQVGHADAEMAVAFWDDYQASHSVAQACAKTIDYATLHPTDVLAYLGRSDFSQTPFGDQSLIYTPQAVCPFH
jgi:hypothetical protein